MVFQFTSRMGGKLVGFLVVLLVGCFLVCLFFVFFLNSGDLNTEAIWILAE